jgi:hypothetical protein
MAYTYSKIATYTVGSGGIANVSFLNIPQTYTDLILKVSARGTTAGARVVPAITFNGSGSSYSTIRLYGQDSSTTGSASNEGGTASLWGNRVSASGSTASTFGSMDFYIPNYTGSNYKSNSSESVAENNSSTNWNVSMVAGLWSNTAAITSIVITPDVDNWAQYSTFHLYGIKAEV